MASPGSRVLLRGGSIYSPVAPFATAMFVVDGEVAWVGEEEAAQTYVDQADSVVQLHGRLVTPGFVDAHAHLSQTGFALQSLDLSAASSLSEALADLEAYAKSTDADVVYAHGWDESRWPEARTITMADIDRVVGARVAYAARIDGHSGVVSTALVDKAPHITGSDGWRGDGVVARDAHHAVRDAVAELRSVADRRSAMSTALREAASQGITSVHEVNAPHISSASDFALLRELVAETAGPEVVPYWGGFLGEGADAAEEQLLGYAGDLNIDGSIGTHTACLHHPYSDSATSGHRYLDAEQVRDHVVYCTRGNLQAGFHVIGDRGMQTVVDGLAAAAALVGDDALVRCRHRLEHVEMVTPAQIADLARWGIVASVQPAFDALWGGPGELYEQRLGTERAHPMNPFASLQRAGVVLAFGSDSPVTPLHPWAGVRAAAYHHNADERLTVRAAFNAHTRGGHRARRDDEAGVLAPAAPATYAVWELTSDLTVQTPDERLAAWSTDPRAGVPVLPDLHPDAALPTCVETVVAGVTVYVQEEGR